MTLARTARKALFAGVVSLTGLALAGPSDAAGLSQPLPGQIDPYAQMEADRVNRENYTNYRDYCGRLRSGGQLDEALQCYTASVKFAVRAGLEAMAAQDETIRKELEAEVKARREQEEKKRQQAQTVASLTKQAEEALGKGEILESRRLVGEALKLDPGNRAAQLINRLVQEEVRRRWVGRIVTWTVLGAVLLGALVAGWLWFRKAKRVSTLEMIEGPQPGDIFRLEKETTVIGALEKEADWPIVDLSRRVSRRHCEITRSGGRYFLVDVSTNGTWVNGRPVTAGEPLLLRRGDLISLADDVVLRFR